MTAPGQRDDGSILVLTAFFALVAALLVVVVVDASAAFLAHRTLSGAADATALAAVQAVDHAAYYRGDYGGTLPPGDAEAAARAYAEAHLPPDVAVVDVATTADRVTVRLRTRIGFRLALGVLPGGATVEAEATARLPLAPAGPVSVSGVAGEAAHRRPTPR